MSRLFFQIGLRIRTLLETNGMSQTELAQQLGVSKQVINKIIQGKKAINVEELTKIASVLNVSLDNLMTFDDHVSPANSIMAMMGSVSKPNTKDDLSFLDHVMDEICELDELLQA